MILSRINGLIRSGISLFTESDERSGVVLSTRIDGQCHLSFLPCLDDEVPSQKKINLRCHLLKWCDHPGICHYRICLNGRYEVIGVLSTSRDHIKHPNIYCNLCFERDRNGVCQPLHGTRFRCLSCDDFDICEICKEACSSGGICGMDGHDHITFHHAVCDLTEVIGLSYSESISNILLNYADLPAIGTISEYNPNLFVWTSYHELHDAAVLLGSGLRALGVSAGDVVVIFATNSVDYMICDIACAIYSFVVVSISPNAPGGEVVGIYSQLHDHGTSPATTLACCPWTFNKTVRHLLSSEGTGQKKNSGSSGGLEDIGHVLLLSSSRGTRMDDTSCPVPVYSVQDVSDRADMSAYPPQKSRVTDLVAIAFTSGTTQGKPKGIAITVQNRMLQVQRWVNSSQQSRVGRDIARVYTSLSYVASREEVLSLLFSGGQAAIYTQPVEGVGEIVRQMSLLRPTFVAAVPAFWMELYNAYSAELKALGAGGDIGESMHTGGGHVDMAVSDLPSRLAALQTKYASLFGNRCVHISTGSAHTPPAVLSFMKNVIANPKVACLASPLCVVYEGYGAMECGGIASNGKFLPHVEWRLEGVEEVGGRAGGESVDTITPTASGVTVSSVEGEGMSEEDMVCAETSPGPRRWRGELLVRTPQITLEYYHDDIGTAHRFTADGYFCTGDIVDLTCCCEGNMRPGCALDTSPCVCKTMGGPLVAVVGRSGAMLKLADGEFLSPEIVEGQLLQCDSILQAFVYAEIAWEFPVAVLVVSENLVHDRVFDRTSAEEATCVDDVLRHEMMNLVQAGVIKRKHVPRGFCVTTELFTVESGLLTVSSKKCRSKIKDRYIDALRDKYMSVQRNSVNDVVRHAIRLVLPGAESSSTDIWRSGLTSLSAIALANELSGGLGISADTSLQLVLQSRDADMLTAHVMERNCPAASTGCARDDNSSEGAVPGGSRNEWNSSRNEWRDVASKDLLWLCDSSITSVTSATFGQDVLLTGACGFLGGVLLMDLLKVLDKDIVIHAIIRPGREVGGSWSTTSPMERLSAHLAKLNVAHDDECIRKRVHVIQGDLASAHFGLEMEEYTKLAASVGMVVHCAAATTWTASYYQLRDVNVIATQHVVSFCLYGGGGRRLCHVSSLTASLGATRPPRIAECDEYCQLVAKFIQHCSCQNSGYAVSKSVAECIVRRAGCLRNLSYVIVRPGTISAHRGNGFSNIFDFTTRLIISIMRYRIVPTFDDEEMLGGIDMACVDYISSCVCKMIVSATFVGETIHAFNRYSTPFKVIIAKTAECLLASSGEEVKYISLGDWLETVRSTPQHPLFVIRDLLKTVLYHADPCSSHYEDITRSRTEEKGLEYMTEECPIFDADVIVPLIVQWLHCHTVSML